MVVGIIPVVVTSGVALKFTEAFLGKSKGVKSSGKKSSKKASKAKQGYPSTQYRPW